MLTDIAKQQLRKAGWYEGRKIDLTKYEKAYAEVGCKLFPAARKFLEEYGDLDIQDKYISTATYENGNHFIVINRSLIDVAYCCCPRDLKLEEMVDELFHQKILRVGAIDQGEIYLFQKTEDFSLIGIVLVFGQKIPNSFGMSTMVKTMVGQLGMI